jgi:hypothetical protein
MIQRSQRHKVPPQPNRSTTLDLHERLASQRLWFLRLVTASAATLVVSFVLWLVRVPLPWHLGGIALSFVAGLFIYRSMQGWAVSWIRERMGLSYETALEQGNQSDSFGFVDSLRERATEEASRLAPPKYQAWWLPMVAIAIGLAFLPLIPRMAGVPTGLTTAPSTTTPTREEAANVSEPDPQEQAPATQEANATNPTPSEPSSSTGETNASELSDAAGTGSANSSPNNQSADEEALGRFLDNLREQPQQESPEFGSMMPDGEPGSQTSDQNNASRPRNAQTNPFEQTDQNQSQAQNGSDQSQSQGQEQQGNQGGQQQDQTQQSAAEASQGEEGQGEGQEAQAEGEQGASEDPNAAGQSAGQQAGQERGQEGEQGGGDQSPSADGVGDSSTDSGQNADGAGSLPGTATPTSTEDIGSSQQNPEFLEGEVSEGPNNAAGTVRLPGETEQTVFPEGSAPSSFNRADEEALTEGRIPLEYQEVIRNYFRGNQ